MTDDDVSSLIECSSLGCLLVQPILLGNNTSLAIANAIGNVRLFFFFFVVHDHLSKQCCLIGQCHNSTFASCRSKSDQD